MSPITNTRQTIIVFQESFNLCIIVFDKPPLALQQKTRVHLLVISVELFCSVVLWGGRAHLTSIRTPRSPLVTFLFLCHIPLLSYSHHRSLKASLYPSGVSVSFSLMFFFSSLGLSLLSSLENCKHIRIRVCELWSCPTSETVVSLWSVFGWWFWG